MPTRERLTKLFEFLKAYTELRFPPVRDINQQPHVLWLKDLPSHPSIETFRTEGRANAETEDSDIVLRLSRPDTTPCPPPLSPLSEWLKPGWREISGKVEVQLTRNVVGEDGETRIEEFETDSRRPSLLREWQQRREQWVANELPARQSLALFQTVYEWYGVQEREGEKIEFMVGDGLLHCHDVDGEFHHPVLLQRLELEFDPEKRQPEFVFRKHIRPPELYTEFLRCLPGANSQQLARCADELKKAEFTPLGGEDTGGFLQRLLHGLFPSRGTLVERQQVVREEDVPTIKREPVIFIRQRRTNVFDLNVVFGGTSTRPIDAAKRVKEGAGKDDWIPSPVNLGESLPLSHSEVAALYQTNARVSLVDERELAAGRPELSALPTPNDFRYVVDELVALAGQNLRNREELWDAGTEPKDLAEFDQMLASASETIEFLRDVPPWKLEAIQAGQDGEQARRVWESLAELIEMTCREVHECHALVMEHGPSISDSRPPHELLPLVQEIIRHIEAGKSFGLHSKLTKRRWFEFKNNVRIGNRTMELNDLTHLKAVRALLQMRKLRSELVERWERIMVPLGGLACSELSEKPERVCKQFVPQIQACLDWHTSTWQPLENKFQRLGFAWSAFLESTAPEPGDNAELRRIRRAVLGDLGPVLQSRSGWLRYKRLLTTLRVWQEQMPESGLSEAQATQRLRAALRDALPSDYQSAYEELGRLKNMERDLARRRELLERLGRSAPTWASAIENRLAQHSQSESPGDPHSAWKWRQLHDELERRASVSLDQLQQQIERLSQQLLEITAQLVEKHTWMNQIRQVTSDQRRALGLYALYRDRITKSRNGVLDQHYIQAARKEMELAKQAVPVWIMPLAEVAETFDPRNTRFDVVIIDEASQCDPTALFALYLGSQVVVVGDKEQVTPTVFQEKTEVLKLINTYLMEVPGCLAYDGETSIYELAEPSFGRVIRLTEHFRCAPNIIAFSNNLSYKGEIKPLREASAIPLHPHVVHYRVEDGRDGGDNVNEMEAETIVSLICAALEQPEYAKNELGEPATIGVISLVGDRQALRIDSFLRKRLEPAEYQRRQILCGDSAQFQGDERDVMFLSVVDSPPDAPPLSMRQEGPKKIFKKRFNVAASRARNQMWIIHSLNHETDLKIGDYRRRIIEHALDPDAWEHELRERMANVDPRSMAFEGGVLRRLMEHGYHVVPQHEAGAYSIDLVVVGGRRRLAIECDGERFHGPEQLQKDLERQAILERLGWTFVRIRGSLFFRDEDRALEPVFRRLKEMNIGPELASCASSPPAGPSEVVERVKRRAQELRASWLLERQDTDDRSFLGLERQGPDHVPVLDETEAMHPARGPRCNLVFTIHWPEIDSGSSPTVIKRNTGAEAFVETIQYLIDKLDAEKSAALRTIFVRGVPLVSNERSNRYQQRQLRDGRWVVTHSSADDKIRIVNQILKVLQLPITFIRVEKIVE
ncbi:MAG: DUF559 domain-containing protein [Verrucomicrobia bacterium]|nr:DUF559 domain-containing protein [Verrucomicrobiota bacterium]